MIDKNIFLSNLLNDYRFPQQVFRTLNCDGYISQNPAFYFRSVSERLYRALSDYALVTIEEAMALCEERQIAYRIEGMAPERRFRMDFEDLVVVCAEGDGLLTLQPNEQLAWLLLDEEGKPMVSTEEAEMGGTGKRISKPGLVPSPVDMAHHADLLHRHGERLLSLMPTDVISTLKGDAGLYLGIAQSLYRFLEVNGILEANKRFLNAHITLRISEDSQRFEFGCEGRNFDPPIDYPIEQLNEGIRRLALKLIARIRLKAMLALEDCQMRVEMAANAVTEQYEVSWDMVEDHTSTSGDFATIVLCRIFDKVYSKPVRVLGEYRKELNGWDWFENEGQSKIPVMRHYKNFDMDYDYEKKTMALRFKPQVVEYLQLIHGGFHYTYSPYPSTTDLYNYDEYLSRCIKRKEEAENLSRHPKYPLLEKLVRTMLADVYPMLGHEDSKYRLKVKIENTRSLEVKLSDSHREMGRDGGCGPLVIRFDLTHGSLEQWRDAWRVAFKRWSVLELKAAKNALTDCRNYMDRIDAMAARVGG